MLSIKIRPHQYNLQTETHQLHIHALIAVKSSYQSKGYLSRKARLSLWQRCVGTFEVKSVKIEELKAGAQFPTLAAAAESKAQYAQKSSTAEQWNPQGLDE